MSFKRHKQYRLPGYDYSRAGAYFTTICTADRQPYFGYISDGAMQYSPIGRYVADNLEALDNKLSHLQLDEWEVMPDHVHLVITLHSEVFGFVREEEVAYNDGQERAAARRVPTMFRRNVDGLRPLVPESLESFINHFKGRITRRAKLNGQDFAWQARFHDRIIRDYTEYQAIIAYVRQNIQAWSNIYQPTFQS